MPSLTSQELERTQAGFAAVRATGYLPGRKRIMTDSKVPAAIQLLDAGTTPRDVARDLGVSIPSLFGWIPAQGRP